VVKNFSKYHGFFAAILFVLSLAACNSGENKNQYGLKVVSSVSEYREQVEQDSSKQLIDLEAYIPGIVLDIRYATTDNFTGEKIYESPKAFVRKPVADALHKVQTELEKKGLGLKVFDAYRPYAATVKFYEIYRDTTFVAAPWTGSVHNTGCAVDVSLVDLETGQELEMPTEFDDFTEKAAHSFNDLPENVINNRQILRNIMTQNGFSIYEAEWWHYNFITRDGFEIMDLSFSDLRNSLTQ
jgi:zinc D-Ala-D-Ala dipeptidase